MRGLGQMNPPGPRFGENMERTITGPILEGSWQITSEIRFISGSLVIFLLWINLIGLTRGARGDNKPSVGTSDPFHGAGRAIAGLRLTAFNPTGGFTITAIRGRDWNFQNNIDLFGNVLKIWMTQLMRVNNI